MNRCTTPTPSRTRRTAAALAATIGLGFFSAGTAHAQAVQRNFPDKALRGEMVVVQPPLVAMDDRPTRLSPGARILDTSNRLVRSATLVNQELVVNYTMDHRGQVHQVWILTEAEAKEKRPGYGTQRNFTFESQQATPAATSSN
ncbi:hypothetical protein [Hydrogenophaga sp.]|uniref:hypothetical protein n=1 Tax=Hydrogenophaga sp. TaxID=1904254 RepID=UPI003D0E9DD5